nr:mitochondrial outer membrane protein porin [Quercus suber]
MSFPGGETSSSIPKPFGSTAKLASDVNRAFALPVPAFGDLGKAANDLINKDFYHAAQATLDVKLKAPNGTNVTVKGKQSFDGVTTGSVEGKHTLKPQGVTITQAWTTGSLLDSKVELANVIAPGAKIDLQNLWNPSKPSSAAQKINLAFKNPNVHSRAFINYAQSNGNIDAVIDVTAGHEGFLVGGEAAYDVSKAAVTRYGLGIGYQAPTYSATVVGIQNLSTIAATYYHKVNSAVEVGAKAGYDVQAGKASGLEIASKYKLDPLSFAKAKINDRGIAALAYSTKLNAGTTLGLGLSLDTQKLNEAGHKIGTSLTFEG